MPENKLNDEKVLAMFVDRLIADKGGDTLDAKQKETLQRELLEELDERIQQAMIRALPDAKLMELEKLLDEDALDEEIEGFFKGADADFDPAIRKAMDEFRTDYFKDKIKVSVKTSILEAVPVAATEAPKAEVSQAASAVPVAPVPAATAVPAGSAAQVTAPAAPAAGQPVQGTVSAVPGQSNVEGVANAVSAIEQGQVPVAQPQVVVQGTDTVPAAPVTLAAQTAPTTQATSAAQATPAAPVAPAAQAAPAASAEQPLQAAPNLMDALNTATESLNAATKNLNTVTENLNTAAGTDAPTANTNVDINTGANVATNTDMTGKEA